MKNGINPKIIILSIGYKCTEDMIMKNILSVQKQDNLAKKFVHIVVDECTPSDEMLKFARKTSNIKYYKNNERKGAENFKIINSEIQTNDDIIIILPLQHWFSNRNSLRTIDSYHNSGCWLTYGSFISSNSRTGKFEYNKIINDAVIKTENFRSDCTIVPSLPLTFRASYWELIQPCRNDDGSYMMSCYEIALFHQLLRIVPFDRIKLMYDPIVTRNIDYHDTSYDSEFQKYFVDAKNITKVVSMQKVSTPISVVKPVVNDVKPIIKKSGVNRKPPDNIRTEKFYDIGEMVLIPIQITYKDIQKYGGKK